MNARLPTTRYVTASAETWSLIRGAYLSGLSAPTVAARFGVSETALRRRARREGWTKRDFAARSTPWPLGRVPPSGPSGVLAAPGLPPDPDAPLTEDEVVAAWTSPIQIRPGDLARRTLAAAAEAVKGGRGLTALRLARAANEIARLDALFEWVEYDPAEQERDREAGQALTLRWVRERALRLAEDIAAGRPLPPEYADLPPRDEGPGVSE
ncbi:hypothetical protein GCM10009116_07150 [Brevundimonas basaltis]|uniref:Uncharacterized protein n=1 Tax=Brevundimonas basaltis TaxID=472166 RepID=A0A7W8I0G5_9CAUL|nr:hypothetical protein [Brevundimonas basaltis]MBB5292360.1 hypothetical protein [Brevundimonas basaltis]